MLSDKLRRLRVDRGSDSRLMSVRQFSYVYIGAVAFLSCRNIALPLSPERYEAREGHSRIQSACSFVSSPLDARQRSH